MNKSEVILKWGLHQDATRNEFNFNYIKKVLKIINTIQLRTTNDRKQAMIDKAANPINPDVFSELNLDATKSIVASIPNTVDNINKIKQWQRKSLMLLYREYVVLINKKKKDTSQVNKVLKEDEIFGFMIGSIMDASERLRPNFYKHDKIETIYFPEIMRLCDQYLNYDEILKLFTRINEKFTVVKPYEKNPKFTPPRSKTFTEVEPEILFSIIVNFVNNVQLPIDYFKSRMQRDASKTAKLNDESKNHHKDHLKAILASRLLYSSSIFWINSHIIINRPLNIANYYQFNLYELQEWQESNDIIKGVFDMATNMVRYLLNDYLLTADNPIVIKMNQQIRFIFTQVDAAYLLSKIDPQQKTTTVRIEDKELKHEPTKKPTKNH